MKLKVMFKDPDTLHDAIRDSVEAEVEAMGLPDDEAEEVADIRFKKIADATSKFVEYGEYILIEFDTDAGTASVLEPKP